MGWSSANEIFDRVAKAVIKECFDRQQPGACICTPILTELIAVLQEGDWDTEDESLEKFAGSLVVTRAFAARGVVREPDE